MQKSLKVTAIMATCGRHRCAERSLSLFLDQSYENKHLLIFQNSPINQALDNAVDTSMVTLINNYIDYETNLPYSNLGAIYNDAVKHIPDDVDAITFWGDDDLFLEDHLKMGVLGLIRGNKTAYKSAFSYFRNHAGVEKAQNTFEPSIFIRASYIKSVGFSTTTTDQHLKWLNPLIRNNDIFIDPEGESTLIYNWGDSFETYKTSANFANDDHFNEYRRHSADHGNGIISPISIQDNL